MRVDADRPNRQPLATGPVVVAVAMLAVARFVATLGGPVASINQIGFAILYLSPVRALIGVPETMPDPE